MPDVGALSVWDGTSWVLMTEPSTPAVALRSGDSFTVTFDVETIGGPSSMPKPIKWVPADHGEPDPYGEEEEPEEDRAIAELLEVLLCPNCDMELSAPACTPQHAYLADNPVEHRLLKPLLVPYLKQLRFDEGRLCSSCTFAAGHDVVIATAECNHVDAGTRC
jgi:hypothetical protein